MVFLRIFSNSLQRGDKSEIGLYEEGSEGGLLGLRIGIMWAFFQIEGISELFRDLLKSLVTARVAVGPRCLRWVFVIESGPGDF